VLRRIVAFTMASACVSCDAGDADDQMQDARNRINQALCSSEKTLQDVTSRLDTEGIQYFFDREGRVITAKKSFNQKKLVSSDLVIEVRFSPDWRVRQCRVRVLHTGP
jgi:hypothetical protein